MSAGAAAILAALGALEPGRDSLPPQVWLMLRHGSPAAWIAAQRCDAAALQRDRAWDLLASAGRWRRRHCPEREAANISAARQALLGWRRLALVNAHAKPKVTAY